MEIRENLPPVVIERKRIAQSAVSVTIQTSIRRKKGITQPRTSVSFTVNDTTPEELGNFIKKAIGEIKI